MEKTYAPCPSCGTINKFNVGAGMPVCGKCKSELNVHGAIVNLRGSEAPSLSSKAGLPVVVDFWAPWCGPCKSFAPIFERSALQHLGKIIFAKVNTDENPLASSTYGIQGIPSLIVFKGGLEVKRISGALPPPVFEKWLADF